jgi:hypothetical protein
MLESSRPSGEAGERAWAGRLETEYERGEPAMDWIQGQGQQDRMTDRIVAAAARPQQGGPVRLVSALVALAMIAFLLAMAGASGVNAQDASPSAAVAHPAHIHSGTCAELDPNPAFPLDDVAQAGDSMVATSTTMVDVSLDDLLASPYAINAHQSADDIATYVACGDITGTVIDGQLLVPMKAQNDSGLAGVAVLTSNDAGGTDVTVYLVDTTA